ncbi:hypothetical protein [Cardinium endosymbiont of Philonthus spinipes]|uniref:hypothetical protein n=1 Tax=Cardinium endosymbiont of Philonthus spinipes TaxID=3077941 RepID=UPI00313EF1A1
MEKQKSPAARASKESVFPNHLQGVGSISKLFTGAFFYYGHSIERIPALCPYHNYHPPLHLNRFVGLKATYSSVISVLVDLQSSPSPLVLLVDLQSSPSPLVLEDFFLEKKTKRDLEQRQHLLQRTFLLLLLRIAYLEHLHLCSSKQFVQPRLVQR